MTSLAMEGHLHLKKRKRLHNFELQLFRVLKTQRKKNFSNCSSEISLQTGLCIVSSLRFHIVSRISYRETG